jgi:glycosyltransferase involved in cell wall biosynthesis
LTLRILLLAQFYPPIIGGEERHVRSLAMALAQNGHHVAVATQWYPGATSSYEMDGDVGVYYIRGLLQRLSGLFTDSERRHAPPFPDPELVTALRRVILKEKPDIVHAHNWLLASFLPLKAWSGAGLVVTLHDYGLVCAKKTFMRQDEICSGPSVTRCLPCAGRFRGYVVGTVTTITNFASGRTALNVVDRFIAVSHAVARYNRLAESGVAFEVIPNFIPDNLSELSRDSDPCLRELPDDGYLLFVGDVMHLKGADILVNAYAELNQPPPLVLIGRRCPDTPTNLPANAQILGPWPSRSAIMHAWRRCLFGVVPSVLPDACPTVVMEAMASGKPVIASEIGGIPDLVNHGETGLLVPPGDVGALRDALQDLLAKRELINRMGMASLASVEHLKAAAVVPRIEQVYKSVLGERTVHAA